MSDLKSRFKTDISSRYRGSILDEEMDIGEVWKEQEAIREENKKLELDYKESKRKARQLKKQIRKNQIGDRIERFEAIQTHKVDADEYIKSVRKFLSKIPKKSVLLVGGVVIVFLAVFSSTGTDRSKDINSNDELPTTLGSSTDTISSGSSTVPALKPVTPDFDLLYPNGVEIETVKISPDNNALVYAFLDTVDGVDIRLSQQLLPKEVLSSQTTEVEKIANSFSATSIIEVDGNRIYHGYNEESGVQSLVFVKNERLILVSAVSKIPDEKWLSYYLDLE